MKKNNTTFDCPVCGNPLIKSKRYRQIRCVYCKSFVEVPSKNKSNSKKEE